MIPFFKPDFFTFQRIERSIFPSLLVLITLLGSCSQQKFAFRNKIAVPQNKEDIAKRTKENKENKEKSSHVEAKTTLAVAPSEVKVNKWKLFKKHNHTAPKSDSMSTASVGKTVIPSFHYKQLSPEETPPRPGRKFEEETGLTNAGLFSFVCGLLTYVFIYYMIIAPAELALLAAFLLSVAAALGAVVLGVMAINQKEGIGFGVLGIILGGVWLFLVAVFIAVITSL